MYALAFQRLFNKTQESNKHIRKHSANGWSRRLKKSFWHCPAKHKELNPPVAEEQTCEPLRHP